MRKKAGWNVLITVLCFCLALGLSACGKREKEHENNNGTESTKPVARIEDYKIFDATGTGTWAIYDYVGSDREIMLPDTYNGNPVTALYYADYENQRYRPFAGSGVETVHIPASITKFYGDNPFAGAEKLKSIVVEEANPVFFSDGGALYNKQKTKLIACPYNKTDALILPETVRDVPKSALKCRFSLGDGTETTVTSDYAHFGTFSAQISSVKLSAALETFTFEGCRNLQNVDFGNSRITHIPLGAFRECFRLTGIDLPASVKSIGTGAFQSSGLETITIRDDVRAIDRYEAEQFEFALSEDIFTNCRQLASITGPAQLLFGECDSSDLYAGECDAGRNFGRKNQFVNCFELETITVNGAKPGAGGTAWAMAAYDVSAWLSNARANTFTSLKTLTYQNGCYESAALNKAYMESFGADFDGVIVNR